LADHAGVRAVEGASGGRDGGGAVGGAGDDRAGAADGVRERDEPVPGAGGVAAAGAGGAGGAGRGHGADRAGGAGGELLAGGGGGGGRGVAYGALKLLGARVPASMARLGEVGLDGRSVLVCAGLAAGCALA